MIARIGRRSLETILEALDVAVECLSGETDHVSDFKRKKYQGVAEEVRALLASKDTDASRSAPLGSYDRRRMEAAFSKAIKGVMDRFDASVEERRVAVQRAAKAFSVGERIRVVQQVQVYAGKPGIVEQVRVKKVIIKLDDGTRLRCDPNQIERVEAA
jgi:hypothetical protein